MNTTTMAIVIPAAIVGGMILLKGIQYFSNGSPKSESNVEPIKYYESRTLPNGDDVVTVGGKRKNTIKRRNNGQKGTKRRSHAKSK